MGASHSSQSPPASSNHDQPSPRPDHSYTMVDPSTRPVSQDSHSQHESFCLDFHLQSRRAVRRHLSKSISMQCHSNVPVIGVSSMFIDTCESNRKQDPSISSSLSQQSQNI